MGAEEGWTWRRWQLVCVADREPVVDIIDITDDDRGTPLELHTVQLAVLEGSHLSRDRLLATLHRWVEDDQGLCDVCFDGRMPVGPIALIQGSHLLIAAASAP